jgi:hypothetical protein
MIWKTDSSGVLCLNFTLKLSSVSLYRYRIALFKVAYSLASSKGKLKYFQTLPW